MVSDAAVADVEGKASIGIDGMIAAALRSERGTAADTVRRITRLSWMPPVET